MNSPAPPPPAPRGTRTGTAAATMLRVVFTAIPLLSLGILAWVPMLRLAVVSRRGRDWAAFTAVAAASTGAFVLAGYSADENDWQTNAGTALLLTLAACTAGYFLVTDLRWHDARRVPPPHPAPVPPPYPPRPPAGRIETVRAELDELSAYLREQRAP